MMVPKARQNLLHKSPPKFGAQKPAKFVAQKPAKTVMQIRIKTYVESDRSTMELFT
jgi:hypothetical protein